MKNIKQNKSIFTIPKDNKTFLIDPPLSKHKDLLNININFFKNINISTSLFNFTDLRIKIREEVVNKAKRYTKNILNSINCRLHNNLDEEYNDNIFIFVTGHAPTYYHPGIWIKNHLINLLADNYSGIGINIIMDSDSPNKSSFALPNLKNIKPIIEFIDFFKFKRGLAYEEINNNLTENEYKADDNKACFYNNYELIKDKCLSILINSDKSSVIKYMDILDRCKNITNNIGEQSTLTRRVYECNFGLNNIEIPISKICETEGFFLFFLLITTDYKRFTKIYNLKLEDYRTNNKIRSKANPFPNLKIEDNMCELPFWIWKSNTIREKIYIKNIDNSKLQLMTYDQNNLGILLIDNKENNLKIIKNLYSNGYKIRPIALTNSIFLRLFLADIFVHGIGGAKYDLITDEIIKEYFSFIAPDYITLSATLYPSYKKHPVSVENLNDLNNDLKKMKHNPDKYIPDSLLNDKNIKILIEEKQNLIKNNTSSNKNESNMKFLRLKEINIELCNYIKNVFDDKKNDIDSLKKKLEYNNIINNREYPIFIHSESEIKEFYKSILEGNKI